MRGAVAWSMRVVAELAKLRTLVVAFAAIALLFVLIEGPRQHPAGAVDSGTFLFIKSIPVILAIWLTAYLVLRLAVYKTIERLEYRDASSAPRVPSASHARRGRDLIAAGFRPLGEMESRFPWQRWRRSWVFVDPTSYVTALVGAGSVAPLSTGWPDGSFVLTVTGIPASVRRAQNRVIVAVRPRLPWADRYRRHVAEARVFGAGRKPIAMTSMADYIASGKSPLTPTRESLRASFGPAMLVFYAIAYLVLAYQIVAPVGS